MDNLPLAMQRSLSMGTVTRMSGFTPPAFARHTFCAVSMPRSYWNALPSLERVA